MIGTLKPFLHKYGIRILIVIMSMLFLCAYIGRKEGYHMDEVLAYQLANAEYNPWIVPTQPVGRLAKFMAEHIDGETVSETLSNVSYIVKDTFTNKGNSILATYKADVYEAPVWIDRASFQNYVQCNSDDDFNLASVYFNVKDDNHPPVHFMLLHMMSSIFKGDMSPWVGCVINLVAVAGVLWLIGLIGDKLFKSKYSTYACMILYGFSVGAVATTIWIRMYALLTLFTVWNVYFHLQNYGDLWKTDANVETRVNPPKNKGIFIMTVLSFWTQYFGLFFILPLAAVTVFLLAKAKQIKSMWAYIRTLILASVVGVCVYPFAIGDVLFSSRGTEALSTWKNGFAEYAYRLWEFIKVLADNVAGSLDMFILLIGVPFIVWLLLKKVRSTKTSTGVLENVTLGNVTHQETINKFDWLLIAIPTIVYFLLAAKMSPFFVDRYIMAIFPMVTLLIVLLWDKLIENKQKFGIALVACTILVCGVGLIKTKGQHPYLYTGYEEQVEVAKEYSEYPMICLYPGLSFYENVMEMEQYQKTLLVKEEELPSMTPEHTKEVKDGYVLLIKFPQDNHGSVQLEKVKEVFGGKEATLIYAGEPFGDAIYLVTP